MAAPVIEAYRLGKRYRLGQIGASSLREEAQRFFARWNSSAKMQPEDQLPGTLWSLRNISFEVATGQVLGIVGRNGSGKSTLLKILSRITEPTEGEAYLRGRVASLLEVGTGFHPELTGRENIFLNGAILGMKHREIQSHFDDIVGFADMARYIDTPIKRYSSGQRVRLAFAVAAHLSVEILIIDEVLAVGDQAFQKRCVGKMQDLATDEGRTVLFVSHNMNAVLSLCDRVIHLDQGRCLADGEPETVVKQYLLTMQESNGTEDLTAYKPVVSTSQFRVFRRLRLNGKPLSETVVGTCEEVEFEVELQCQEKTIVALYIRNETGTHLAILHSLYHSGLETHGEGVVRLVCRVPKLTLAPASYIVDLAALIGQQVIEKLESVGTFSIGFQDVFGTGLVPSVIYSPLVLPCEWKQLPR